MTGSTYEAEDDSWGKVRLSRYPDAGENPVTARLNFEDDEEDSVYLHGETLRELLKQLKKDDPGLFEYLTSL